MEKVYVVTKANLLEPEIYVAVRATKKAAEKVIRDQYPNARKDDDAPHSKLTSYVCRDRNDPEPKLMFIREEDLF